MGFTSILKAIFSKKTLGIIESAYPIVSQIAQLCPNRTAQEIFATANKFGVNVMLEDSLTYKERGEIMKKIAVRELQKKYPNQPIEELDRMIQSAYNASKGR